MSPTTHTSNQAQTKEGSAGKKHPQGFSIAYKFLFLLALSLFLSTNLHAQKGPFLRISMGTGILNENTSIHESGFTYVAKNHAIGWGFNDKYAVYYSEFGAFTRKDIGDKYQFINLDAYALGFAYNMENDISLHASGGYGTVHFSDSWKEQGDYQEDGYAIALGVNKKWGLAKRIDLGVGPLVSFYKTESYTFTSFSLNFWLDVFLFKQY